jgi:hypothetical protein
VHPPLVRPDRVGDVGVRRGVVHGRILAGMVAIIIHAVVAPRNLDTGALWAARFAKALTLFAREAALAAGDARC